MKILSFFKKKGEIMLLIFVVVVAFFLRFKNISKLNFFTYDQARDDLIVKRILVDRKFTLLGPQSSIGGVYLPPAYYYTLTIPLWFFNLSPVGPNVYTAFVGVLTSLLIYFAADYFLGKPAGIFSAILLATSPVMVQMSRTAWNPNTLPFFSLLSVFLAFVYWQTKKKKFLWLSSLSLGYTLSLHYSAFCLLPGFILILILSGIAEKKVWPVLIPFLIIFLFFLPLFVFDIRHDFNLTGNLKSIFLIAKNPSLNIFSFLGSFLGSVYEVILIPLAGYFVKDMTKFAVPYEFLGKLKVVFEATPISIIAHKALLVAHFKWGVLIFAAVILFSITLFFKSFQKNKPLFLIWVWFLSAIFFSRLFPGKIYFFYYLFLFPVSFVFMGAFLRWLFNQGKWLRRISSLTVIVLVLVNFQENLEMFAQEKGNRSLKDLKDVAAIISTNVEKEKFNVTALYKDPGRWDHQALDYRYFIEAVYKKRPLDWYPEDYQQSQILYLISEGEIPNPISSKIMEMEAFGPQSVVSHWNYRNKIYIYKLSKK